MTEEFKVGDKVRYVPDPDDKTAYYRPPGQDVARVAVISTPEEAGKSYIGIRFSYNPEVWPVRPDELERIKGKEEN